MMFPMDVASTLPFQYIYRLFTGKLHHGQIFGFLNLLRLWRLRRVSKLFSRLEKDTRFSYFWTRYIKLICVSPCFNSVYGSHLLSVADPRIIFLMGSKYYGSSLLLYIDFFNYGLGRAESGHIIKVINHSRNA